jgi:hypothetical protein
VGVLGEELPQPLGGLRDRVRPRDGAEIEAEAARRLGERRLERRRIVQKSRSA